MMMMTMLMMMMMAMMILLARTVMVIIRLAGVNFKDLDDHHLQVVEGRELKSLSCGSKVVLNQ